MLAMLHLLGTFVADLFKSRRRLEVENLFLRYQFNIAAFTTHLGWLRTRRYDEPSSDLAHHHINLVWTASSLCTDMIFGNDKGL